MRVLTGLIAVLVHLQRCYGFGIQFFCEIKLKFVGFGFSFLLLISGMLESSFISKRTQKSLSK